MNASKSSDSASKSSDIAVEVQAQVPKRGTPEYYSYWEAKNIEEAKAEKQEELEKEKQQKEELKKAPVSAAQKKDTEARKRNKAKRKAIEKLKEEATSVKVVFENEEKKRLLLDPNNAEFKKLDEKKIPALQLLDNRDCTFRVSRLQLTKIFVENCHDLHLEFCDNSRLLTEHIELYRCRNVRLHLRCECATVQIDSCQDIDIIYDADVFTAHNDAQTQLIHSQCQRLSLRITDTKHAHTYEGSAPGSEDLLVQYRTHMVASELVTERVFRPRGFHGRPITMRQLQEQAKERQAELQQAQEKKDVLATRLLEAQVSAAEAQLQEAKAEVGEGLPDLPSLLGRLGDFKAKGNKAFGDAEYSQAAYHYSEAILELERNVKRYTALSAEIPAKLQALHSTLRSNRAACFLKNGQHEQAAADAKEAVAQDPKNVKAHFRLGLALRAQGKPEDSIPHFAAALKLKPKNKDIQRGMKFAQMQAAKKQHERMRR